MRPFFVAAALLTAPAVPLCAIELRQFDDAALHAVQFIDANEGWAVGDEGVIWHTIDGGKNWERQPSGVRASLRSVNFLNPFTGWVVGRQELPHGQGSVGVILMTRDGGLKWQPICANMLPGLNCVRFFDDRFGVIAGDGSDQFPTGVFLTSDGGKSWKALPGPRCPSWQAADFQHDAQNGALVGSWSRLATLRKGALGAADVDTLGGRSLAGLQLLGQQAVAVGQGGLILVSGSGAGVRWGFANLKLPAEVLANLDFRGVCSRGDHVWVVGRPGSVVLHSPDRGQTWDVRRTGQAPPLNAVHFHNENQGWAVGELGTILTTTDGGKTWQPQRQGGQRAAVLFISARPENLPVETTALLGADDGYLVAALQVAAADPASAPPGRCSEQQRLAQAMRHAGGAAGEVLWQFPLPEHLQRAGKSDLIAAWDRVHAGRAAEQFLRQLVLAIRIWRPEVIVADIPRQVDSLDGLLAEGIVEAFKQAGDPKAFPEQVEQLGLKPWSVRKVCGRCETPASAPIVLDLNEYRARLGGSAREFAAEGAALLTATAITAPKQVGYRLLASRVEGAAKHRHLMQGITLAEGGTARRTLEVAGDEEPADQKKAAAVRRQLDVLTEVPVRGLTDPNRVLAEIGPLLEEMPADKGAAAAFAVASQFARTGQWNLARETFLQMVDRYPAHPSSIDAYRWLIRYSSSSEARRRQELGQFLLITESKVQQASQEIKAKGVSISGGPEAVQQRQLNLLGDLAEARKWYQGALAIEPRLTGFGPLFGSDPAVQFPLQAARRHLGKFDDARQWYTRFQAALPDGPWRDAAAAELWLETRHGPPPKLLLLCRQTGKRPYLDGKFDDECWQGLVPARFRNVVGKTLPDKQPDQADEPDYSTEAMLAWDRDFLYFALRCKQPAERHVPPVKVRSRDAELADFDRVSLLLDLDRDYSTFYHLQVDQRGCLCEDCWGDRSWNPRWFVAIRSEPDCWQIEAAIPLIELTGDPLTPGRCWAVNLVRILPGRGVQAWSAPADVEPRPEGMGLLLFTSDQQKK